MFQPRSRRQFLRNSAAGGTLLGLGNLGFLSSLEPVTAADAALDTNKVRFSAEIEPIVRLLEETPRDKLLEEVAGRIRAGLSYQEVLAALLLAGVRNVQPRPSVGFKFHAVLVVNSAHLASLASPPEHRWLPIFWALDEFKDAQAADAREGDWTMAAVDEAKVPSSTAAKQAFIDAMESWDPAAVDVAVAGLARTAGANEVYELLYRFGARDFRDIGHKAIFVANSQRTLNCIGWHHAEPVLRSLAYALVKYDDTLPSGADLPPDRPWKRNLELAKQLKADWLGGKPDSTATRDLLSTMHTGSDEDVCRQVVEIVNRGVSVSSVWDALFVGASELLARQPGIVALHAVTSTNALRYAFEQSASDDTRRMLLLQNASFVPLFRQAMQGRGRIQDVRLDQMEAQEPSTSGEGAIEEIFADVSKDRMLAARKSLAYLKQHPEPTAFVDAARLLIFLKGTNSHDYKFSSAIFEDFHSISPEWRDRYLAAGVFQLRGSAGKDNDLVARTRAALGTA